MNKLSWEQRRAMANFLGSFAVAWLASGVIVPYLTSNKEFFTAKTVSSLVWAGYSLYYMLYFTRGGKK